MGRKERSVKHFDSNGKKIINNSQNIWKNTRTLALIESLSFTHTRNSILPTQVSRGWYETPQASQCSVRSSWTPQSTLTAPSHHTCPSSQTIETSLTPPLPVMCTEDDDVTCAVPRGGLQRPGARGLSIPRVTRCDRLQSCLQLWVSRVQSRKMTGDSLWQLLSVHSYPTRTL